jgi:hypothetical protein
MTVYARERHGEIRWYCECPSCGAGYPVPQGTEDCPDCLGLGVVIGDATDGSQVILDCMRCEHAGVLGPRPREEP